MAFDAYLQISGIEGESTDEKHPGLQTLLTCDGRLAKKEKIGDESV
jgi:type VI protein secretion system component Hcp